MLGIHSLIFGQKHTSSHLLVYAITMLTKITQAFSCTHRSELIRVSIWNL